MSDSLDFTLREAGPLDLALIQSLANKSWRAHYPGIISEEQIEYMLDWMYSVKQLEEDQRRGVEFLLIETSRPMGFAGWEVKEDIAYLHKLYLIPEAMGRGLGSALLAEVTSRAKERGVSFLQLGVNKYNAKAIKAYERNGFERFDSVCNDIGQGFVMDDYLYRKRL